MSTAFALAGVTALLKDLLNDGLINDEVTNSLQAKVTAQPIDRLARKEESGPETSFLNLYLYRVTPNTGWVNERLPARSSSGERLTHPYLALDLAYLLTAFGHNDLEAELLLGFAMQVLHENPVLPRERIRASLSPDPSQGNPLMPSPFRQLDADALAEQLEQIRISPWYHDTEEMSRLWSSLNAGLRPSALYKVTVVLIESRRPARSGPPVKERRLHVPLLQRPRIENVLSIPFPHSGQPEAGLQINHRHRLVIEGSGLRGALTRLRVGDRLLAEGELLELGDRRIRFDLPPDLQAGLVALQVEHALAKGPPAPPGARIPWSTSNHAAFALAPSLLLPLEVEGRTEAPAGVLAGTVILSFQHPVGERQKVELLLDEVALVPEPGREAYSYSFPALPLSPPAAKTREAAFQGVRKAIYLLRARIDGVASEVGVAAEPGLPPDIAALAAAQIYSAPVLDLR